MDSPILNSMGINILFSTVHRLPVVQDYHKDMKGLWRWPKSRKHCSRSQGTDEGLQARDFLGNIFILLSCLKCCTLIPGWS